MCVIMMMLMMFDAYQRAYAYSGLEGVIKAEMDKDVWSLGKCLL